VSSMQLSRRFSGQRLRLPISTREPFAAMLVMVIAIAQSGT
jgi:hypothetical protein